MTKRTDLPVTDTGPASTNDLGVLESQPLGWVYDKHRRESINADVPEGVHGNPS